jgi:hypothetical protein
MENRRHLRPIGVAVVHQSYLVRGFLTSVLDRSEKLKQTFGQE